MPIKIFVLSITAYFLFFSNWIQERGGIILRERVEVALEPVQEGPEHLLEPEACWDYQRSGTCRNGDRCGYSHLSPPGRHRRWLSPGALLEAATDGEIRTALRGVMAIAEDPGAFARHEGSWSSGAFADQEQLEEVFFVLICRSFVCMHLLLCWSCNKRPVQSTYDDEFHNS